MMCNPADRAQYSLRAGRASSDRASRLDRNSKRYDKASPLITPDGKLLEADTTTDMAGPSAALHTRHYRQQRQEIVPASA